MKSGITVTLCQSNSTKKPSKPTSGQNQTQFAKPAEVRFLPGSVSLIYACGICDEIDKNPQVRMLGAEIRRKRYYP